MKASVKENRKEKIEYYREYDRNRPNSDERNEKVKARTNTLYNEDPVFREKILKAKEKWADLNKHKREAQWTLSNAIRDKKITRGVICEHCQDMDVAIQGHHWSYLPEHRLDVVWLCVTCHGKEHSRLNEIGRDPDNIKESL